MLKLCIYCEKQNMICIPSKLICPKSYKKLDDVFALSYIERINKFCPDSLKDQLFYELSLYPDAKISEYC